MRPISQRVKKVIDSDPFYRKCVITGTPNPTMEHCWLYGKSQIDEVFAIVPLAAHLNTSHPPKDVKDMCRLISLRRATQAELAKYPKKDWERLRIHLEAEYGARVDELARHNKFIPGGYVQST